MPDFIRLIEIYVGYSDNTWDTKMIPILKDTPEDKVEEVAIEVGRRLLLNNSNTKDEVSFIGIYHIPPIEKDDDGL